MTGSSINTLIANFDVQQPDPIQLNAQIINAIAGVPVSGSINLTVTGGITPYSYIWSNGETTQDISGLTTGIYDITVTDANGCTASDSYHLWSLLTPPEISGSGTVQDPACNASCNASIDLNLLTGGAPVYYFWSDGSSVEDLDSLCAGNYEVSVYSGSLVDTALLGAPWANYSPYYFSIDSTTEIEVCFWADHSFVSDLGFYLAGPNGEQIDLLPSVSGWDQGASVTSLSIGDVLSCDTSDWYSNCNSGNNLNGFCFTSSFPAGNLNYTPCICDMSTPLTGDFASCESWSELYGLLPTDQFTLRVTDCNSGDVGYLQQVTLNITGQAVTGTTTYSYSSGAINYTINDNSCTPAMASSFTFSSPPTVNSTSSYVSHNIVVDSASAFINGLSFDIGDCIAVFYEDGFDYSTCCGYFYWTGSTDTLKAWQDNPATTLKDGFTAGDSIYWKLWRVNEKVIMDLDPLYQPAMPNQGLFATNGLSAIDSLIGWGLTPMATWTSSFLITDPLAISISPVVTDATSAIINDGAIDLTISGGTSPYTVLWSNGESTEDIDSLIEGTYGVTVTDANLCAAIDSFEINNIVVNWLSASGTTTNTNCYNSCDGAIDLTVSGGLTPYFYNWSNGETTEDVVGLCAGFYSVTIIDSFSDTASLAFEILQPDPISVTASITNATNSTTNDGAIDITVTGGVSPYSYYWGYQQLTEDRTNLLPGVYLVTVTDANTCQEIEHFVVGNASNLLVDLKMYLVSPMNHCEMNNSDSVKIILSNLGGMDASNFNVSYNLANSVSVTELITDTIPGFGSLAYTFSTAYNGAAYQFEPNLWLEVFLSCVNDINPANDTVSGIGTGSMANVFPYFTVNNDVLDSCLGSISIDSFYADNSFGWMYMSQYHWDEPGFNSVTYRDSLCSGTYTLYWSDGWCWDSYDFEVGNDSLMIQFSTQLPTCSGMTNGSISASLNYSPGGNYSYLWSTGDTTSTISGLTGGTYHLTINENGAYLISDSVVLIDPPVIVSSGSVQHVSAGGFQDGAIDLTVSGGTSPYTILWSNGETMEDIDSLFPSVYEVTVSDANLCTAIDSFEVSYSGTNLLSASGIVSNNSCYVSCDGAIDLTVSGGNSPYSYFWSNGETTEDIDSLCDGNYDVTVSEPTLGSSASWPWNYSITTTNHTILIPPSISLDGNPAPVGSYVGVFYFDNGVLECGGYSYYSQTFSSLTAFGDESITPDKDGFATNEIFIWKLWANSTEYDLVPVYDLNATNQGNYAINGMSAITSLTAPSSISLSFTITQPDEIEVIPVITPVSSTGLNDGAIDITVSGGVPPYSFTWSNGASTEDINSLAAGIYGLTFTDANNCSSIESFTIYTLTPLSLSFGSISVSTTGATDGSAWVIVSGGVPPYQYQWWQSGSTNDTLYNLGSHYYHVTVTDALNDQSMGQVYVGGGSLSLSIGGSMASETGASDGLCYAYPYGGTPPFTYIWSTGTTTDSITGLFAGTYSLTITDNNSMVASAIKTVYNNKNRIWIEFVSTPISTTLASDGEIDITCSGGLPPYSYSWSTGSTAEDLLNLSEGLYQVWVTDNVGITDSSYIYVGSDQTLTWTYMNTGNNHSMLITDTIPKAFNGNPVDVGDYIGAFYEDGGTLHCAGYCIWAGSNNAVTIWGNDYTSGPKDGFYTAESFNWFIHDASANRDYNVSARYHDFPNYNHYFINGISSLSKLGDPAPDYDLAITGILHPLTRCDWNSMTQITVEIANLGTMPVSNFQISYQVDNFTTLTEVSPSTLMSGDTVIHTFIGTFDASFYNPEDTINLTVFINSGGSSTYTYNDTLTISYFSPHPVVSLQNDFMNTCVGSISIDSIVNPTGSTLSYYWGNTAYGSALMLDSLCVGNYTFFIDDGICTDSFVYEIGNDTTLMILFTTQLPTCSGMTNGSISANLNYSPGSNYSYLWSTGDTTSSISGLSGGIYHLTINENGMFLISDSVVLVDPPVIVSSGSVQHVSAGGFQDGAINLTVSGGIPPYIFVWSNGATTEDITNLSIGNYGLTITDSNGCFHVDDFNISYINPPAPLSVSGLVNNASCNSLCDGLIDLTPSGGLSPYTFNWSTGDTTEDLNSLCPGTYDVTVGSSAGTVAPMPWINQPAISGYDQMFSGTVKINGIDADPGDYLIAFYPNNGNLFLSSYGVLTASTYGVGGVVQLHEDDPATPQKDGFAYWDLIYMKLWRHSDGALIDLDWSFWSWFGSSSVYNFIGQGYGSAEFYGSYSQPSWSPLETIQSFEITAPSAIQVSQAVTLVDPAIGNNGAIDITVAGGTSPYTFAWSNGATIEDISGLIPGPYTVTVLDNNSCTKTKTISLGWTYPPSPIIVSDTISNLICNASCDGAIGISVSGGAVPYSFLWSNGETNEDLASLCAGNYGLTVYCPSDTLSLNYVVNEPVALASNPVITQVDPAMMNDGAIDLTPSGGTSPYSFAWSNGATTEDISNLVYGEYIITITDANLCQLVDSIVVNYSGTYLSFDLLSQPCLCNGSSTGSAWVNNIVGVTPYTFAWSNGASTDSIYNIPAGTYIVTVSGGNGDVVSDTVEVLQPDELTVSLALTYADPVLLIDGAIDATESGGTLPYSYLWSNGSVSEDLATAAYGAYQLTVTDDHLCEVTASTFVDFNLLPDWNFNLSGISHSIEIPGTALLQINGSSLGLNDFIGVFYDSLGSLSCGGYVVWQQNTAILLAYGDNPSTAYTDGFVANEEFEWIVWDVSTNTVHLAAASYNSTYPNQQFWQANGQSGLDSLQSVTISGTVSTTTKASLPLGMIVLYQPGSNSYYAVDKGKVINGQFEIDGLLPGDYLVYAIPVPGHDYGIPGYYATRNDWQDGHLVHANGYTGGIDIVIDPVQPYATGVGAISGNIYVGSDASYNPDVFGDEWFPASTKLDEIPARNIVVLLFDDQMEPLDFRLSNDLGAFEFGQMELGTYFVKVEKAGLQSSAVEITLNAQNPTWGGLNFSLETGHIISVYELARNGNFILFPNPVTNELYIQMTEKLARDFTLKLFSVTGQELHTELSADDSGLLLSIDMGKFNPGIYFIEVSDAHSNFVRKIIKGN
ncbi:MAG: T9SS type A sorting domain-containing protein [Bacteroidales bacterium]|nr:T9SS type A sorting domain-containing protein [Bacteroidales bacterium]MCF8456646.1 T9SS type A sorting domain-containing protein [Bacteroidales bacterium]